MTQTNLSLSIPVDEVDIKLLKAIYVAGRWTYLSAARYMSVDGVSSTSAMLRVSNLCTNGLLINENGILRCSEFTIDNGVARLGGRA